ncbi:MAG: thiamine-binding protein [Flavobacteriaceae bacterium]|nr:thiamine-binding protein [Flavobacteriaceae bacterium]
MNISVELTFTPLQDNYEEPIKELIKELRQSNFKVLENPLSTQVYGEYNEVMDFLTRAMQSAFKGVDACIMNMKVVKSDRSGYKPDF